MMWFGNREIREEIPEPIVLQSIEKWSMNGSLNSRQRDSLSTIEYALFKSGQVLILIF